MNSISTIDIVTQSENLIIEGLDQIDNLKIKLSTSLRTAKRLNDLIILSTSQNFKDSTEYECMQSVFDSSCELEQILDNINSFLESLDSPLLIEAVHNLRKITNENA